MRDDHFEILGVTRNADAEEVRAAYRRAAKRAHPDGGGSHEAFLRVQKAAEALLADLQKRSFSQPDPSYSAGDRTSAEGSWMDVAEALRLRWGLGFAPIILFAPQKIGLSPFATTTSLNAPAYQWLTRTIGPRGETWDFHVTDLQTRMFFRRADDARLFKLRFF